MTRRAVQKYVKAVLKLLNRYTVDMNFLGWKYITCLRQQEAMKPVVCSHYYIIIG